MNSDSDHEDYGIWDFKEVRRLCLAFSPPVTATALPFREPLNRDPSIPDISKFNPKCAVPKSLGDLDRLLRFCGKPIELDRHDAQDSSSQQSDPSTPPTSAPEDNFGDARAEDSDKFTRQAGIGKTVQWKDEMSNQKAARIPRRSVHDSTIHADSAPAANLMDVSSEADTEPDYLDAPTPTPKSHQNVGRRTPQSLNAALKTSTPLIPHSISPPKKLFNPYEFPTWVPPPILKIYPDPSAILPIYTVTNQEQKAKLVKKLGKRFSREPREDHKQAIARLGSATEAGGIHVFVDLSNIHIGYQDQIKCNRGIPKCNRVRTPPLSFSSLALILERGRRVARRVLAGSTLSVVYGETMKLHKHVTEAEEVGYELNILERVSKPTPAISQKKKKKHGTGTGYGMSGNSSASESGSAPRLKLQEQAVDELLQMKILESIVDTEQPSTIVLASGDAAEAEFSGGFLKNVERALAKGWKVEVAAWKNGLSYEYRSPKLLKKWGSNLSIIELDEFCEEMLALYTTKVPSYIPSCVLPDPLAWYAEASCHPCGVV